MSSTPALFQPVRIGVMNLCHRVVMAPLTRFRADDQHVPKPDMVAEYYAQRASVPGTLLITEATFIAPRAGGYANAPGIWSEDQINAWKKVTTAVHAKGSFIYLQLWALGRAAISRQLEKEFGPLNKDGLSHYVAPSPIALTSRPKDAPPRGLTQSEIAEYVQLYAQAAENAVKRAGFDGVEIHGANGYLIDQFLQDMSNHRTDGYGGSIENRAKFALEVVDAVVKRIGETKTGLRISPWSPYQDMGMKNPIPTFTYLVTQLKQRHPNLAYIHATEKRLPDDKIASPVEDQFVAEGTDNDFLREIWSVKEGKHLITAGGYTRETGIKVAEKKGDIVAYGRLFISNPDLPYRLKQGISVVKGDRGSYYTKDTKGYTDYPFSDEFVSEGLQSVSQSRL